MYVTKKILLITMFSIAAISGCASYRTDSNISSKTESTEPSRTNILITEGVPDKKYKEIGSIEISIKKLTAFHKDPTKEQADAALTEKAKIIGADAVIKTTYKSGVGLTTWGYIDASGIGVKFIE